MAVERLLNLPTKSTPLAQHCEEGQTENAGGERRFEDEMLRYLNLATRQKSTEKKILLRYEGGKETRVCERAIGDTV